MIFGISRAALRDAAWIFLKLKKNSGWHVSKIDSYYLITKRAARVAKITRRVLGKARRLPKVTSRLQLRDCVHFLCR